MTVAKIKRDITYFFDKEGQPTIVQLDLRNKVVKEAYEEVFEKIEDYLDTQEAMARDDDDYISHEDVKSRVIALLNAE